MEYISLYRKYRPKTYSEIVGQEHITRTFQNAVKLNRLSHAYLFCGPRGTGKTTLARVLAKSLNCIKGPTDNPCNECDMCNRIDSGFALDVIEIDAASNRTIDDIREIIEKIKFYPVEGKRKIYIVDEVHMLTPEAFNAFLKTLEEPPLHTIFVLATTEPHKLPATILSRCQRFDFKRISVPNIVNYLKYIAEKEKIYIEEKSCILIAKASEGAMRDAISILDKMALYSNNKIYYEDIINSLGMIDNLSVLNIVELIISANLSEMFNFITQLIDDGKEPKQICKNLIDFFRNLLLIKVCQKTDDIVIATQEYKNTLKDLSKLFTQVELQEILNILLKTEISMKWETQPKILLETSLIKIASLKNEIKVTKKEVEIKKDMEVKDDKKIEKEKQELSKTVIPLDNAKKALNKLLSIVKKENTTLLPIINSSEILRTSYNTIILGFSKDAQLNKDQAEKLENKKIIEKYLSDILMTDVKIKCEIIENNDISIKKEITTGDIADVFGNEITIVE